MTLARFKQFVNSGNMAEWEGPYKDYLRRLLSSIMAPPQNEQKPEKIIVVSYIPLFYASLPAVTDADTDTIEHLLNKYGQHSYVNACAWVADEKTPEPVFIMERAEEIYEHLMFWSGDKPEAWFKFFLKFKESGYNTILFPDVKKSIYRLKYGRQEYFGDSDNLDTDNYYVITLPLTADIEQSGLIDKVKPIIEGNSTTRLGFLDIGDFNGQDIDKDKIKWAGPFPLIFGWPDS